MDKQAQEVNKSEENMYEVRDEIIKEAIRRTYTIPEFMGRVDKYIIHKEGIPIGLVRNIIDITKANERKKTLEEVDNILSNAFKQIHNRLDEIVMCYSEIFGVTVNEAVQKLKEAGK